MITFHYHHPQSQLAENVNPLGKHTNTNLQVGLAGTVMIFKRSRNAATGDNSMYCMIPDPFHSTAFGKRSAIPD